jgi:hypothetical protein
MKIGLLLFCGSSPDRVGEFGQEPRRLETSAEIRSKAADARFWLDPSRGVIRAEGSANQKSRRRLRRMNQTSAAKTKTFLVNCARQRSCLRVLRPLFWTNQPNHPCPCFAQSHPLDREKILFCFCWSVGPKPLRQGGRQTKKSDLIRILRFAS